MTQTRRFSRSTDELDELSVRTRELILRSVFEAGAGHIGGPLSVTDILVNLYFDRLLVDPDDPHRPDRDVHRVVDHGAATVGLCGSW